MNRKLNILLGILMAIVFVGCGNTETASVDEPEQVAEVQVVEPEAEDTSSEEDILVDEPSVEGDPNVDLDLTVLSSTMVYSEVFKMMMAPEEYEGTTIKMDGI